MEDSYLVSASERLLLDHGLALSNCRAKTLDELVILYLRKLLLKEVGLIQYCTALRSCTVANNFITDIAAVRECVHVVRLDLHGNQNLPGKEFWKALEKLKLLYLHNNQISNLSNVESLSYCPALAGLTLYDTPLSLQKGYRHIAVNSIWSLKAFDNFVISDEEIIEAWTLHGRFKALCPDLHLNLLPAPSKDFCLQNDMKVVNEIIRKINGILARCSPVLIVQKWIRGYLVRRRLGLIPHLEMQRKKSHYQRRGSVEEERKTKVMPNNLPALQISHRKLPAITQPVRGVNRTLDAQPVMHITVDLRTLQQDVLQVLPEAEIVYDLRDQIQPLPPPARVTDSVHEEKRAKDIKVTKQQEQDKIEPGQQNDTEFNLFGSKAVVYESNPSKDLLASNAKSAKDIRSSVQQIHSSIQAQRELAHVVKDQLEKRCPEEGRYLMNLLPLCAVDRAYENREKYDRQVKNRNLALQVQTDRKQARYNVEEFLEGRKKYALDQNEKDGQYLQQHWRASLVEKSNFIDKVKHRQEQFHQQKEARKADNSLAREFNTQHTSVTKTLLRHDRIIRRQEEMQEKAAALQSMRENQEKQKEFTTCLQKHRQLVLQIENASEKVTLGSLVLQKANDRLHEAQTHVTTLRGHRNAAEPMYKVAVKQPVSKETQLKPGRT
ncbi:leucine-rich repeat and IQ domain-containing protein 3 isoform X2 [Pseudophryne corroboree]|uniref:leucine-rich repeat and IQ domain-containing protein 3 isoform X2 n=1 Tax=Pseudophryne corroboree TaxID=495146 RepID=UPI0030817824